jgi:signal transduction histidine kinase
MATSAAGDERAVREAAPPRGDDAALRRIAMLVLSGASESEVFAAVCEEVAPALGVEASAVLRFSSAQRGVVVGVWRAGGNHGLPVNAELDFDARNSALGRVAATGQAARADGYADAPGELPHLMDAIEIRASAAAPVWLEGRLWGAVVASRTSGDPLPADAEARLVPFAELVGHSLGHARARRRLAEAHDESRRRLERGLHAGARQHLLALTLKLRLARERSAGNRDVRALLDDALAEATAADAALRDLAQAVHPALLEERGLAAALQALAAKSRVRVRLRALPGRRFPPAVETTAYRVVAESLANVAAHAHATEATIALTDSGDRLLVEVTDDGIGGADPAGGGLRALADRVAAVGGRLSVASRPGEGTAVRADLPLSA